MEAGNKKAEKPYQPGKWNGVGVILAAVLITGLPFLNVLGIGAVSPDAEGPNLKILDAVGFARQVLGDDRPAVVEFYAQSCGACRVMARTIVQASEDLNGTARVFKVDVGREPDLADQFRIAAVPTVMVFKNRHSVGEYYGAVPRGELVERIKRDLGL